MCFIAYDSKQILVERDIQSFRALGIVWIVIRDACQCLGTISAEDSTVLRVATNAKDSGAVRSVGNILEELPRE